VADEALLNKVPTKKTNKNNQESDKNQAYYLLKKYEFICRMSLHGE
jgi:hypothetical protein